jgi:hypothetical protein
LGLFILFIKNARMKNVKLFLFGAAMSLLLSACAGGQSHDGDSNGDATHMDAQKQGPEFTSAYVCPMHCKGSGSDQAGKCPVCGMDYVVNKDHKKDHEMGHDEGHGEDDHEGHDHQ